MKVKFWFDDHSTVTIDWEGQFDLQALTLYAVMYYGKEVVKKMVIPY